MTLLNLNLVETCKIRVIPFKLHRACIISKLKCPDKVTKTKQKNFKMAHYMTWIADIRPPALAGTSPNNLFVSHDSPTKAEVTWQVCAWVSVSLWVCCCVCLLSSPPETPATDMSWNSWVSQYCRISGWPAVCFFLNLIFTQKDLRSHPLLSCE